MHALSNHYNGSWKSTRKDLVSPNSLPYHQRIHIIKLLEKGYKDVDIMRITHVKRTCYYKYKPLFLLGQVYFPADIIYRRTGSTNINARKSKIEKDSNIDVSLIRGLISDASATIKKSQIDISTRYGIFISFSTIQRWRHDQNLTYKKLTMQPKEANRNQCLHFIEILNQIVTNINQLAYFDESHSNRKDHNPTHGWSIKSVYNFYFYYFVFLLLYYFCDYLVLLLFIVFFFKYFYYYCLI